MSRLQKFPVKFFFLAGGLGTRARPLSYFKPKPLFPLHGTPLIEIMLKQLKEKGLSGGFVNLHYRADEIREAVGTGADIRFFYEKTLSGSKILKEAADFFDDLLLVVNGDIFLEIPVEEMTRKIRDTRSDAVLLVRPSSDDRYPPVLHRGDRFLGIGEENPPGSERFMYPGVALFRKEVVKKIDETRFFDSLAKYDFKIKLLPYGGIWLDMGEAAAYFRANFQYKKYLRESHPPGAASNSLSKNVFISADSSVCRSIIWDNTSIKSGSAISDCIVTGNCSLENRHCHRKIITPRDIYNF